MTVAVRERIWNVLTEWYRPDPDHAILMTWPQPALPGGQEVRDPAAPVDRRHHPLRGAGQRAGAVDHLPEHRVQVQRRVDAERRAAQPRDTVPERPVLPPKFAHVIQWSSPRYRGGIHPNALNAIESTRE